MAILKTIELFSEIGSGENLSTADNLRVRRTNQLALIAMCVLASLMALSAFIDDSQKVAFQLPMLATFPLTLLLNYFHQHRSAKFALISSTALTITGGAVIGGQYEAHQLFFLVMTLSIGTMFGPNEWRSIIIGLLLPLGCWIALEFTDFKLFSGLIGEQKQLTPVRFLNSLLSFLIGGAIIWRFAWQQERAENRARQSVKMAALGEMAAGMGHEINNPLTIISVAIESVRRRMGEQELPPQVIHETFDTIQNSVKRIARIADSLRKFSRSNSADPMIRTNVQLLVESALTICQHRLKHLEIELKQDLAADAWVFCRESEIVQVLVNLLNNAIDAVSNADNLRIETQSRMNDEGVEISVADSGSGVPTAIRDKIMEPFFTTKDVGHGTGLGLSVSSGIIRSHGGTLLLDERSPNTRFVVTLPISGVNPLSAD
jgi:signal transduction histidine kinase